MTFFQLFILATLQGLTEFLPVSSSGHLVLAPKLLGEHDQGLVIDVALHVGTLLAVLLYYWRDLWQIAKNVLMGRRAPDPQMRNLGWYIALASIPAFIMGGTIHFLMPDGIRSVAVITATTLFFGFLMGIADMYGKKTLKVPDSTLGRIFIIGCAQALALIPGTSRSGITMTAARFMGYDRVDAARLSFLIGIPAIAGAGAVSLLGLLDDPTPDLLYQSLTAIGLSFVAGLLAIHFMMFWLKRAGLLPFVFYRMFLGGFLLVYFVL